MIANMVIEDSCLAEKTRYHPIRKNVRGNMKSNHLVVKIKKTRKYSPYIGEVTKATKNLINRSFHSNKPNSKMLTDITEFSIPDEKVYLSPSIDCFDGMVSAWKISTNHNTELVNLQAI